MNQQAIVCRLCGGQGRPAPSSIRIPQLTPIRSTVQARLLTSKPVHNH